LFEYLVIALLLVGYVVIILLLVLMCLAPFNRLRYRQVEFDASYEPVFTLIVPAYNEEDVVARTIELFLETDYPNEKKEIIIVNDGSKDNTAKIVAKYASKIIDSETGNLHIETLGFKNVTLLNRLIGGKGKAYVVNDAMKYASGQILFFIDADVRLSQGVFKQAAAHFKDPKIGAVAGFVDVYAKKAMLNRFIDFESVTAQKIMRLGFDTLGIHYIIPGGCAIFRKKIIAEIGGYQHDTLAEDTDITWRIATETDKKIRFDPSIVVVADEPTKLMGLWNQRVRWARGNLGVTLKHKYKLGRAKYHKAATVGYPFWASNVVAPVTFLFVTFALILGALLNINTLFVSSLGRILSFSFFAILVGGIYVNRGRSWFGGLMAPGVPLLFFLVANVFYEKGVVGLLESLGYYGYAFWVGVFFVFWLLFCVVGTGISLKLSERHARTANFLQLGIFGYWVLLVLSVLYGYYKELRKERMVWIRTER
jgi:cellulose synthase/poly-beta-1,6-N-acetylglucosamine synthase-like glycosyltransferase